MQNNQASNQDQQPFFKQTQATKDFFVKLHNIQYSQINSYLKTDLETCAKTEAGKNIALMSQDHTVQRLINYIFTSQHIKVAEQSQGDFDKLRVEARALFGLNQRTAIHYINAYLADVAAQNYINAYINAYLAAQKDKGDKGDKAANHSREGTEDKKSSQEWTNLDYALSILNHALRTLNHVEEQNNVAQDIVRDRIIKVMEKLGEDKLKDLIKHPGETEKASVLENIGHYINQLIRAVTFGLAGYEFSDKEAKEALNSGLNIDYNDKKKSLFGLIDNNTRLAQVVNEDMEKREAVQQRHQQCLKQDRDSQVSDSVQNL